MSKTPKCKLSVEVQNWPISGSFNIARGAKTVAEVVVVRITPIGNSSIVGKGECVPYRHYGESVNSVFAQIENVRAELEAGINRQTLLKLLPAGAARNAIDCALWDLEAKRSQLPIRETLRDEYGIYSENKLITAYTISLGSAEQMYDQCLQNSDRALLKIKLGGDGDEERMLAVRKACPNAKLILDANEAWRPNNIEYFLNIAHKIKADLVEQPLPADEDNMLGQIERHVNVCADESVHTVDGLKELKRRYDCINIKLDKTGGLTGALELYKEAKMLNFSIMVGCMVATSLSMAPALLLAQQADFIDLDGPLLLEKDIEHGLVYENSFVDLPNAKLWG